MEWQNLGKLHSKQYTCGYCGNIVASDSGYWADQPNYQIFVCPHCKNPSYFMPPHEQVPGVAPGNEVDNLPDTVSSLFREARNCAARWPRLG